MFKLTIAQKFNTLSHHITSHPLSLVVHTFFKTHTLLYTGPNFITIYIDVQKYINATALLSVVIYYHKMLWKKSYDEAKDLGIRGYSLSMGWGREWLKSKYQSILLTDHSSPLRTLTLCLLPFNGCIFFGHQHQLASVST